MTETTRDKAHRFNLECGRFCHDDVPSFSLLFKSYITSTKIAFFLSGSVSELSARVASNLTTRVGVCPHPFVRSNARYRSQRRGCGAANETELPALQASK